MCATAGDTECQRARVAPDTDVDRPRGRIEGAQIDLVPPGPERQGQCVLLLVADQPGPGDRAIDAHLEPARVIEAPGGKAKIRWNSQVSMINVVCCLVYNV